MLSCCCLLWLRSLCYFADDCFMSVTFQYRFPTQKPPKVSLRLLEMPVKYFCISPGGGGEGRGREKVLSFFAYISHLSRKQFKELCFRCLLNSFWCSFSGWNPFWNEIQLKFFRINIYQFVKIWSKAVNVKALWSYSWSISRFLGHFYSSSSHFEPSLILPFCTQFAEKLRCEDYALLQDSLTNIIKHGVKTAVNNFSFSYTSMVVRNLIVTVSDMAFK